MLRNRLLTFELGFFLRLLLCLPFFFRRRRHFGRIVEVPSLSKSWYLIYKMQCTILELTSMKEKSENHTGRTGKSIPASGEISHVVDLNFDKRQRPISIALTYYPVQGTSKCNRRATLDFWSLTTPPPL